MNNGSPGIRNEQQVGYGERAAPRRWKRRNRKPLFYSAAGIQASDRREKQRICSDFTRKSKNARRPNVRAARVSRSQIRFEFLVKKLASANYLKFVFTK